MRPLWLNSKMEPASVMTESTSPIALWSPMARDIRLRIADRTGLYYFSADFPDSGTSAVAAAMLGRWAFAINNQRSREKEGPDGGV
ncbi:hypothetical protein GQ42DRAFT_177546 [Ramicandelaber brevisporus]|nr:hypothetical protein GQ42DRAFT_177546 [Ramicandelaber brevisporus]